MDKFMVKTKLYLQKIFSRLLSLDEKINHLTQRVEALGQANGMAYSQTKKCISELAQNQESVQSDLSDAMGTIREATWAGC